MTIIKQIPTLPFFLNILSLCYDNFKDLYIQLIYPEDTTNELFKTSKFERTLICSSNEEPLVSPDMLKPLPMLSQIFKTDTNGREWIKNQSLLYQFDDSLFLQKIKQIT